MKKNTKGTTKHRVSSLAITALIVLIAALAMTILPGFFGKGDSRSAAGSIPFWSITTPEPCIVGAPGLYTPPQLSE